MADAETARVEIQASAAALLAAYGPLVALVVLPDDPAVCCRVGFEVIALPAGEALPPGLVRLGVAGAVPLYVAWPVAPATVERIVLACDATTGTLTAVFL